jgi:hypothetical protein
MICKSEQRRLTTAYMDTPNPVATVAKCAAGIGMVALIALIGAFAPMGEENGPGTASPAVATRSTPVPNMQPAAVRKVSDETAARSTAAAEAVREIPAAIGR